ncbi:MAG TPA: 6-bladed beta-propeller [Candidatus Krumholzibacteria bacterium]|nr:6-bladed beta-propeller [Candidatus Krumholzibacteria bacterium]HPD72298.1 6-bladed beta-propeller [Candidatus Krumholzibacteria bacterium]HRY40770.1 6-bladed beta-propeller [Candidatus Krumholzibacteria bacterium]
MNARSRILAAPRPRSADAAWLVVVTAALALILAARPAGARTVVKDGVPHVENGPTPRDGVQALQLEEAWRRGGEDDDEVLLGIVTSVLTDSERNLYVLDAQLMDIKVFNAEGELTGTLGRQGEGPGEFQNAQQMTFLPGRKSLGVAQTFPGKLVGINLDGTPGPQIAIGGDPAAGGFSVLINATMGGDNLVVSGIEIAFDQASMAMDRHHYVRSYDQAGARLHEFCAKDVHWVFDSSFTLREAESDFVWWRLAVDGQGRVLIGEPREDYVISVYGRDGKLERVFGREYETFPRPAPLLARYEAMMEAQSAQLPPGTRREVAANEQDIWGIHCHGDGTYWVATSRGMYDPPAGAFTAWDVFSPEGEYLRQVTAAVPGTPGTDFLFMTDHGYAVMVTGFWDAVLSIMGAGQQDEAAEPMQLVCYRIR